MIALGVSYLGDHAHHELFARSLAASDSSLRWAGSAADADIVLIDRLSTVVSGAFLVSCPFEEPPAALPAGIRGVLNCAATTPVQLLALATEISQALGPRLTPIEIEVLTCAAAGMTIEDTAQRLDLTTSGGRSIMDSARRKLGARTRANAVALAFRHGLVR
ncbi:LuxR C-terminal-related transcriptional regulator [Amycolatopsis sp. GM8]|uniref:helix-turn-helix transcriptional regulator n=1 Tax=Amycolatopsis sp. GM8 TaxID=2896530 RepID=UPI001F0269C7|nr:LuxR C-terminal-related transcriptional regulator [Amycolatopsis sp. GM8]